MNNLLKRNFIFKNTNFKSVLKRFSEIRKENTNLRQVREMTRNNLIRGNNNIIKDDKNENNLNVQNIIPEFENKNESKIYTHPRKQFDYIKKNEDDRDLIPQQDLKVNIRAKGIFERDPNDTKTPKLDYIYGYTTILSAISADYRKYIALYVDKEYENKIPRKFQEVITTANYKNIKVLDKFTADRTHDGFVLKSEERDFKYIKKNKEFFINMKKKKGNIIVLLDKVIDPQNFGSILRTCYYYGIDYVVVNKKNRPNISPAVCQVSLGTSENMEIYCVKLFKSFVQEASESGWKIITTSSKLNKNKSVLPDNLKIDRNSNVILIFGSEAEGLEDDIFSLMNFNILIPPQLDTSQVNQGVYSIVESLNVGVSSGIILHSIKQKML